MAAPQKTLVVGSVGHQHVTSVSWHDVNEQNIVDFDVVIINTRSLTQSLLKKLRFDYFKNTRIALSRLLTSGGEIIVLGTPRKRVQIDKNWSHDTYSWSPVDIGIAEESGDTIKIHTERFKKYFYHFKKWDYYYFLPSGWLSRELENHCGSTTDYDYRNRLAPYAENRYSKMLSGIFAMSVTHKKAGTKRDLGNIVLLPFLDNLDERIAVNLILEDLLSIPQATLPPEWVKDVTVPGISEIDANIVSLNEKIRSLNVDVERKTNNLQELENYKKLLYSSGNDLEDIFARCLTQCGGTITPAKYSQEEFILHYKQKIHLIECKGLGKSVALSHLRQLLDYMLKFEEEEGKPGKGILFGNAWKDLPPQERGTTDTPVFPRNVIERGVANGISLVSSVEFFKIFSQFLSGEIPGEEVLDRITNAIGVAS